ncbi:MAG: potassium-transporting ATPase subunit KdpA [Acidobacteria bacterium]|nr:potassium-transporting ATPase subunit KdpA [Acidobacteriota bacterium]MBI3421778.1 potassium-transporting ATPase subunit KdpA [Acidobacteriota bacterium]
MTINGWLQILLFFAVILAVTKPLGVFMTRVFNRERTLLDPVLRPLERLIYRLTGVDERREMRWTEYSVTMLLFSLVSMLVLYALQRLQYYLPFNPQKLAGIIPHSSFNTAASFTTNTNWQSYVPEVTMSYLTQMAGLAYHNFVSAAVGIALAIAFIRGIAQREKDTLGNFWVDMTRAALWVCLPFCLVGALVLVAGGVPQNLRPYDTVKLLDPQTIEVEKKDAQGNVVNGPDGKPLKETQQITEQVIAQGPVASQESIKEWGTNGGGFFNANSAHPFENPTPLTNFLEMIAIFAVSAGLTYTLGRMTGSPRHGWAVFAAMSALFFAGILVSYWAEAKGNPLLAGVDQATTVMQSGGNMEGKEVRFGLANTALWATITTDASCGAVNGMHDSFTPLGGLVPLANIMLSEVVFGGVGAGLYGILIYVVLAVFIAGLMVGRTPEYLGKKVEAYDVKMAMLNLLIFPLTILVFTAISSVSSGFGTAQLNNGGPHGLTEMLYAFTSGTGNNGSAFAGISANTYWYNTTLGAAMLLGRFFMIIPMLALAGSLGRKKIVPPSLGTFPVTTPLFATLLVSVILIVGALTFFPVLSLGPIVEHLLMQAGQTF